MSSQFPSSDPPAQPWLNEPESARSRTVTEMQRQLVEAQQTIRRLQRELGKEQGRHAETSQAYNKTVANMVEIARENAVLTHELERLKRAASARSAATPNIPRLPIDLTPGEIKTIRKAMARLHHPDVGGDEQRMKLWNALLDQLDEDE